MSTFSLKHCLEAIKLIRFQYYLNLIKVMRYQDHIQHNWNY